jgi:hypothetical protein
METLASYVADSANTPLLVGAAVVGGVLVLLLALFLAGLGIVYAELSKPCPREGTPVTLPNGMRIKHWQKAETDFLYKEIFGDALAYTQGGIRFRPGQFIVDAGANIGMFALYAAKQCAGDATIVCFEPMPTTFSVLKQNALAANEGAFADTFLPVPGAALSIRPFMLGLSDGPAEVVFEHHPYFSIWSTTDAKFAGERRQRILDDLVRLSR